MSKRARRVWLLISFLAAGALAPLLMRPSQAERDRLEANYNEIAAMTRTERLRLNRNFAEFQAMSPADQARYRDLHDKLEADRQSNGVHVEVMDVYYDWFGTLRGDQRETLRKETDPQARRELAEVIIDEQQAPPPEFGQGGWRRLSGVQLDAVFTVIEANVPFTQEQEQQLAELAPPFDSKGEPVPEGPQSANERRLRRHLLYLQFLIERFRSTDDEDWALMSNVFKQLDRINIFPELLEALGDDGLEQQIMNSPRATTPVDAFSGMIWWSVMGELNEYRRVNSPTDDRLDELFDRLPPDQQDELLALGSQDFRWRLRHMYFREQFQDLNPSQDVRRIFNPRWFDGRRRGE